MQQFAGPGFRAIDKIPSRSQTVFVQQVNRIRAKSPHGVEWRALEEQMNMSPANSGEAIGFAKL